ncbi:dnaJ homolog subfamily C member 11-like [Hyalella azteca]|uniref:DnaJ homolog subfamily C member 11-like n=1 Tax=Hyalella azteca TaxID=294128 RepID=A0A8B7NU70_HYAAZ|nr:dnaJ homolog subfamily C member 11-like [Hyalella azteca]
MSDSSDESVLDGDDYYSHLNIPRDASAESITNAYHRLSKLYHPDKHRHPERKKEAELLFGKIKKAYEGQLSSLNGRGTGSMNTSLRYLASDRSWVEVEVGVGSGCSLAFKLFRRLSDRIYCNAALQGNFTANGIRLGSVFTLASQLDKSTTGYLTWKLGLNSFGGMVEYSAEKRVTQHTFLSSTVCIGGPLGVHLKLRCRRATQTYTSNIILCDDVLLAPIVYGTALPVISWLALDWLVLQPYQAHQKKLQQARRRQLNRERMSKLRREGAAAVQLMRETVKRIRETEENKKGLVITRSVILHQVCYPAPGLLSCTRSVILHQVCYPAPGLLSCTRSVILHQVCYPAPGLLSCTRSVILHQVCYPAPGLLSCTRSVILHQVCYPAPGLLSCTRSVILHQVCYPAPGLLSCTRSVILHQVCYPAPGLLSCTRSVILHQVCYPAPGLLSCTRSVILHQVCYPAPGLLSCTRSVILHQVCYPAPGLLSCTRSVILHQVCYPAPGLLSCTRSVILHQVCYPAPGLLSCTRSVILHQVCYPAPGLLSCTRSVILHQVCYPAPGLLSCTLSSCLSSLLYLFYPLLLVYATSTHCQLPGFFDPCPGENKSLYVEYLFHAVQHKVIIRDTEPLKIPKQSHRVQS